MRVETARFAAVHPPFDPNAAADVAFEGLVGVRRREREAERVVVVALAGESQRRSGAGDVEVDAARRAVVGEACVVLQARRALEDAVVVVGGFREEGEGVAGFVAGVRDLPRHLGARDVKEEAAGRAGVDQACGCVVAA